MEQFRATGPYVHFAASQKLERHRSDAIFHCGCSEIYTRTGKTGVSGTSLVRGNKGLNSLKSCRPLLV
jgi:hypothetical protein